MPSNFVAQSKQLRNLVLSPNKQAAWQGTLADANLTQRQRFDGSAVLNLAQTRRDDKNYAGRGTFFATNGQITGWGSQLSNVKCELSPWLAGWLMAFGLGADTITGSGPYTHAFTYDETTSTAVPTTIYCEDTNDVKYKLPDMALNDLTLTISDIGAIMADFNLVGTGRYTPGAMGTVPALAAEPYILGSDCVLTYGPTGALVSFLGRHMNTTFKWENGLIPHKAPGLGLYAGFTRKGPPKFSFATTIAAKDTDDVFTNFLNDTETGLVFTCNSGAAAQLIMTLNVAHLKAAKIGFDNDMTIWSLEYDETTAFKSGTTPPVSVQVINSQATYLVGA